MPSKLPVIKGNTSQENIDKMKIIASSNKRSLAKELEWLVEKHIAEYEAQNGEIVIENKIAEFVDMLNNDEISYTEKVKQSFKLGIESTKK